MASTSLPVLGVRATLNRVRSTSSARLPLQAGIARVVRAKSEQQTRVVCNAEVGAVTPKQRTAAVASATSALSLTLTQGGEAIGLTEAIGELAAPTEAIGELAALGLDQGAQLLYLSALLALLATGTFLVVRQILVRRELEETAKDVGERVRSGNATGEEYFELGVVLLRKKSYSQAVKNLERSLDVWDGEPEEKAQAYNALGFALFMQDKHERAAENYKAAVELQSGYITAWNNLGNAYEKLRKPELALEAYEEALSYAPDNEIAKQRAKMLKTRLDRLKSY